MAMMAQAGLPVPATAASFPILTAFLADIGDAQSIEAALSTFSAHITNLDRLSRLAGKQSLVLLDELVRLLILKKARRWPWRSRVTF